MAIPARTSRPGTYFITTATYNRRRLFQVENHAALLLETIERYRASYLLHAWVIMPDHIHLLLTPRNVTLERAVQLIKGGFSHSLASKLPVWQRGFTDHRIRDTADYLARYSYIHQNPVAARLCGTPAAWPFSSANPTLHPDRAPLLEAHGEDFADAARILSQPSLEQIWNNPEDDIYNEL